MSNYSEERLFLKANLSLNYYRKQLNFKNIFKLVKITSNFNF